MNPLPNNSFEVIRKNIHLTDDMSMLFLLEQWWIWILDEQLRLFSDLKDVINQMPPEQVCSLISPTIEIIVYPVS